MVTKQDLERMPKVSLPNGLLFNMVCVCVCGLWLTRARMRIEKLIECLEMTMFAPPLRPDLYVFVAL